MRIDKICHFLLLENESIAGHLVLTIVQVRAFIWNFCVRIFVPNPLFFTTSSVWNIQMLTPVGVVLVSVIEFSRPLRGLNVTLNSSGVDFLLLLLKI